MKTEEELDKANEEARKQMDRGLPVAGKYHCECYKINTLQGNYNASCWKCDSNY